MNQFPQAQVYNKGRLEFCRKFVEIFAAQGAPPVALTTVTSKKSSIRKVLPFFEHLGDTFFFKFTLRWQKSDSVPIICHRYQQRQRYRWQNLPPVSLIPVANFPPVSLIMVVRLYLRISSQIFKQNRKDSKVIFGGSGEVDSWKNLTQKISWHCPFYRGLAPKYPSLKFFKLGTDQGRKQ